MVTSIRDSLRQLQALDLSSGYLGIDTETTGLNPYGTPERWGFYPARPYAFSFCDWEGNTAYVRWQVNPKTRKVLPESSTFKAMQEILNNSKITKIGHNIAYDLRMLTYSGFKFSGSMHDTLILAHVVTGGCELTYGLKQLGVKYLKFSKDDEEELQKATSHARREAKKKGWFIADKEHFGREPIKADYWLAPLDICEKYAVQDAIRTMMFYRLWKREIEKNPGLRNTYEMEMRLFHVVRKMEERGVKLFYEDMKGLFKYYENYIKVQSKEAEKNGGKGLNFKSHKQMTHKFYVDRGHEPELNEKGNPSLNGKKLVELSAIDPLARNILEFRGANHMLSSFLKPYDRYRVQEKSGDWVLHPNFKQCGPVTGRFSCSDPSIMTVASEDTIRRKSSVDYKTKLIFGPRNGYIWYLPDYKQIEVWVFAFLSQDPYMMKSLLDGHDFHGAIAEKVWSREKDYEEFKSSYRKRAKLLMFCKIYGGGVKKIAFLLECYKEINGKKELDLETAQKFVDQYDQELPGVSRYMKRMINMVRREGKIVNPFGRHYYIIPDRAYCAVNYMIQGTCADIMKRAMINVDDLFTNRWKDSHILITLHDELICEVSRKYHSKKLMREMVTALQGNFHTVLGIPKPLPVSMEITEDRWMTTKEIAL